ncbi:hypothetical protein HYH03_007142 [Edaphochlamys debaryana]|uniref:Glycosyltransferase family 92 protein n=1 Tax=Edaphochlamys debaryana TaxID=47281 RepID=A0A836C0L6_9CHLO|nr:hypothetical protein HYH03_007142 [Edaphochlamys debaryana]|eukprot:KAG2494623.1 hypothetical protein HYH03_007142 [Edaphochlamys debaryana]
MFGEVADYAVEGKVQYTYLTSDLPKVKDFKQGLQGRVFQRCFDEARGYFTWMMFTDLDEYTTVSEPSLGHRIPDVLRSFEGSAGAVLAHRRSVGSGGLEARAPGQGVLASFSKCSGMPGDHLKGIAHLDYADVSGNAHMFNYRGGRTGIRVGDNATVLQAHAKANPTTSPLLIYHYMGSVGEYARRAQLMGSGVSGMTTKDLAFYRQLDSNAKYDCPEPTRIWAQMVKDGAVRPRPAAAGPAVAAATVPVKAASAFQVPHQRQRRTQHGWSRVRQAAAVAKGITSRRALQ